MTKTYWIVTHGEVVSQAGELGEFENIAEAKEAAFAEMYDGDTLCDAIQPDKFKGFWREADDCESVTLWRCDDSFPAVMVGLWWWSDDPDTFLEDDGSETERDFVW